MNIIGKLATVASSAAAAGIAAHFAMDYWVGKSLDADSGISRIRRFVRNNREVVIVATIVSTGVAYKMFHTKHVCVDDSGETGLFTDGTVRVLADDLRKIIGKNKGARWAIEHVGEFLVTPYTRLPE